MHVPVMLTEMLDVLKPASDERYIDASFGKGGYSRAILQQADCHVLGLDRDPDVRPYKEALKKDYPDRFQFIQDRFSNLKACGEQAGYSDWDGVILDIGVSSMQLDQRERGFSFMRDGPLDMRMSQQGETAEEVINTRSEAELSLIFKTYGEERKARKIAWFIVRERAHAPIKTTGQLADLIGRIKPRKKGQHHPATRVFQALRIEVNRELEELETVLNCASDILKPGGRLIIVSFHSLEDRIVKRFFQNAAGQVKRGSRHQPERYQSEMENPPPPLFVLPDKWRIKVSEDEIKTNPRARSALLRYGYRSSHPLSDELTHSQPLSDETGFKKRVG